MKILFITRKYPPETGGMENFAFGLISNISSNITPITLGKSQIHLIWFLPYALFFGVFKVVTQKAEIIHLCDGLLTPIGFLIGKITGKPVTVTAHGLDINYNQPLYQMVLPFFLRRVDHIVCVSSATQEECIKRGVEKSKTSVITNAITPQDWNVSTSKDEAISSLEEKLAQSLKDKTVLLSVGRPAKRKGFRWFASEVMTILPKKYIYLIAGGGSHPTNKVDELQLLQNTIEENNLQNRVFLLGRVSDNELLSAYTASDVFLMPNIPIKGDMEGFGIVAIEAGATGLPVVASKLEGVTNAVLEGTSGYFATPEVPDTFASAISKAINLNREQVKLSVRQTFSWERAAQKYQSLFQKLIN